MDMKNIILDVDGTLWNTTDIVADSWTRALRTCDITDITVTGSGLASIVRKDNGCDRAGNFAGVSERKAG